MRIKLLSMIFMIRSIGINSIGQSLGPFRHKNCIKAASINSSSLPAEKLLRSKPTNMELRLLKRSRESTPIFLRPRMIMEFSMSPEQKLDLSFYKGVRRTAKYKSLMYILQHRNRLHPA